MERAVVLFVIVLGAVKGADWHYGTGEGGLYDWKKDYPMCGGMDQSPINFVQEDAKYTVLPQLKFEGYDSEDIAMRIINDGHTAMVRLDSDKVSLTGGNLTGSFKLAQIRFHWGSDDWRGSEHSIEAVHYPAEMQLIHYNKAYASLDAAMTKSDGLAVFAILFEVGKYDNSDYAPIISGLKNIIYKGESQSLSSFKLESLLPEDVYGYYRYNGSLTQPNCQSNVTWTVFGDTVSLSASQLQSFRSLKQNPKGEADVPMTNNYRDIHMREGRDIWFTMIPDHLVDAGKHNLANIFLALVISIVAFFATR